MVTYRKDTTVVSATGDYMRPACDVALTYIVEARAAIESSPRVTGTKIRSTKYQFP